MATNYERGVRFERLVIKHFKSLGCITTRSSGSHGMWDIVAVALGPMISSDVYNWLGAQSSKAVSGFLDHRLQWPSTRGQKWVYYKALTSTDHHLVILIQCKSKQT